MVIRKPARIALEIANGKFRLKEIKVVNFIIRFHSIIVQFMAAGHIFADCSVHVVHTQKGTKVWKPCKFYPTLALAQHTPALEHRQYNEEETMDIFGAVPPTMSDLMQTALSFIHDSEHTLLIRNILPTTIRKLLWIIYMKITIIQMEIRTHRSLHKKRFQATKTKDFLSRCYLQNNPV